MAEKTNAEILYEGLIANPKIKGLPSTFNEFNSKVLQNPANMKTLYDGLIQNPAIKGLPNTFDSFQKVIAPPTLPSVQKPVAQPGPKPIQGTQPFYTKAWDWVADGLSNIVGSFSNPTKEDEATAENVREGFSTPETDKNTPQQQAFNSVKRSNELFANVTTKLKKQYPKLDSIAINQLASKELGQLGYEYKKSSLADGRSEFVWSPIPGFKPDQKWLTEQRQILTNQQAEAEKNLDRMRGDIPGYKATQWIPTQALRNLAYKLDEFNEFVNSEGKIVSVKESVSKLKEAEAAENKYHDELSLVYTAPLVQPRSNSYTGLRNTDFNDPKTYGNLDQETAEVKSSIPKSPTQIAEFKMNTQLHGVDMDYYNKPYLAAGFKWNNVVSQIDVDPRTLKDGPEKDAYYEELAKKQQGNVQSEMFYAKGLQLEKLGLKQDIVATKASLDTAIKNVATLQENIKNHGYYPGAQEDLEKNLLIQNKLQANLDAKNELLGFYDEQEKGLTLYNDHLAQKVKSDRIAEVSPMASLSTQFAKMLVELPGRVSAVGGDLAALTLSDAEKPSFAARKLETTQGGFWDYFTGKGTTFGSGYTGIKPETLFETPTGQKQKGSLESATTLDILDEEGNWKITFNGFPTLYQTGKVAVESFMLGKAMFQAAEFFAPMKAAVQARKLANTAAIEEATANSMIAGGEGAAAFTGVETASSLGLAATAKAITMAETMVGSVAPSIVMFGDEMYKAELAKGLTHDQAMFVGTLRASIEGLTERAFPNEMLFYKMLTGKGIIKSYANLAENAGYRELIEKTFEKQLGKRVADKFVNYILNPTTAMFKVWGEEGAEEVLGLLLGEYPNKVAKGFRNDYEVSESFTSDAAVSTMVQTMATMLPMGGTGFAHNIQQYSGNQLDAKIAVGNAPSLYVKSVQDMQKEGLLSKEEVDRRLNYINKLRQIAGKTLVTASQAEGYNKLTKDQQEAVKRNFFKKFIEQDQLNDAIKNAPTDEEKLKLATMMDNHNLSLKTLLEEGIAYTPKPTKLSKEVKPKKVDELTGSSIEVEKPEDFTEVKKTQAEVEKKRVENAKANLGYYTSDSAIETATHIPTLANLANTLNRYAVAETDTVLKAAYEDRVKKVNEKIAKLKAIQNKTPQEIAETNNAAKKITIDRPQFGALNLKFGVPYHISSIDDVSKEGKKIIRRPEIIINKDNGNGTLNVSWNGETADIDIADLAKFKFTEKSTVEKWRKEKDPKAFVFDNENNVFTYEFNEPTKTRDKVITGRLRYNTTKNAVELVYKDKEGNEATYVLDKSQLQSYRDKKGKLKLVKALETEAQFAERQAKSLEAAAKVDFEKLQSQAFRRFEFIIEYIEEKKSSLKETTDFISRLEDMLLSTEIEMEKFQNQLNEVEDIRTPKTRKVRADIKKLIDNLQKLQNDHRVLLEFIEDQEIEKQKLEDEIEYLKRYEAEDFESNKTLANQLMDDLIDLDKQKEQTIETISMLNELANGVQEVINKAVALINNLIKGFESRYGKERTALSPEQVYDVIGVNRVITKQYGEEASFIKKNPYYIRNVELFQSLLDQHLGKLDISEHEMDNLKSAINANMQLLEKIGRKVSYQEDLIKAAEKAEAKYKAENHSKKIQSLADRIFKSFTDNQSTNFTGDPSLDATEDEPSKLDIRDLFSATAGVSDLSESNTYRLQTFLNSVDDISNYRLMVVTKDNAAKFGLESLIYSDVEVTNKTDKESDNDIVLVVAKFENDKPQFPDLNGDLSDKAEPNKVVYTKMRMARLTWTDGRVSFIDKGTDLTDAELLQKGEPFRVAHAKFRQYLIDKVKEGNDPRLVIKGISRGFNTQANTTPQSALKASALPSSVDLANTQVVFVPSNPTEKTGMVTYQGTNTNVRMPKGRPVFSHKQRFFFLNNRRYTSKDVLKFQKVFKHLFDNLTDKKESEKIIKFLEKTLYIRNPEKVSKLTDKPQESELGRSQIWLTKDKDQNLFLNLHNLPPIPFNFDDGNVTGIFALEAFFTGANQQGVYHNVDAKDLVGKEFVEYYLDDKDSVKERVWPSYQAYLISDKLPNGAARAIEDIPLTTTLAPSTDTTPNKTGRYLVYSNFENEKVAKANPSKAAEAKIVSDEPNEKVIKVSEIGSPSKGSESLIYVWEHRKDPLQKDPTYSIVFSKSAGKFVVRKTEDFPLDKYGEPFSNEQVLNLLLGSISKYNTEGQPINIRVRQVNLAAEKPKTETKPAEVVTPSVVTQVPKQEPPAVINPTNVPDPTVVFGAGAKKTTTKKFRVATGKSNYEKENMAIARQWWEERYPNIPFKVVEGLVDGIAYGAIHDHSLTLSNVAEVGTVYHEAYEAVEAYFLSPKEIDALNNEFRRREGSFVEYGTGKVVDYSKATDDQAREQRAEEYREYEMSGGTKTFQGQVRKRSIFRQIYDWIRFLFSDPDTINDVFEKISSAKYKDKIPFGILTSRSAYRLSKQMENPVLFREIMNGMTNLLFQELREKNIGVMDFLARDKVSILARYQAIKDEIDAYYGGQDIINGFEAYGTKENLMNLLKDPTFYGSFVGALGNAVSEGFRDNIIQQYGQHLSVQAIGNIYDIIQNYKDITSNWPGYVDAHKEYLSAYKIEFEDDFETTEEDVTGDEDKNQNEYSRDMLKFSVKQNANTEVKMLIATLKKLKYAPGYTRIEGITPGPEDTISDLNSMLMSELVDYGKVVGKLLHKLAYANTFDEMVDIIRREAIVDPTYQGLLNALKVNESIEMLPYEEAKYIVDLRNKFFTSFSNMKPETLVLILDKTDGTGASIDVNDANAVRLVKEKWLSHLKDQGRDLVKFVETTRGVEMKFDQSKFGVPSIAKERDVVTFLNNLGIDFTIGFERLTEAETATVMKATQALHKLVTSNNADSILFENKLSSESLTALATIYVKYSDFYNESQHLNIEGEPVQNVIIQNFIGMITKVFNASKNLDDLIKAIPQLTPSERNGYISSSQILNKSTLFFNTSGSRTRNIPIKIFEGARVREESSGIPTSNLAESDFIAQEFSHNLNGNWYIMIPADAKTEWGVGFGHFMTQLQTQNDEAVATIMRKHLAAEILAAQQSRNSNLQNVRNYGLRLRQFEDILKTVDPKFELPLSYDKTPEQIINENLPKINEAIKAHFDKKVDATYDYFVENNVIKKYEKSEEEGTATMTIVGEADDEKLTILFAPSSFIGEGLSTQQIRDLIRFREINYQLNVIEQHKLFWGDPAQWTQMEKRTKSFVSGRGTSVHSSEYFNSFHNTFDNVKVWKDADGNEHTVTLHPGEPGYVNYDDLLRVQSYEDVIQTSEHAEMLFNRMLDQNAEDAFGKKFDSLSKPQKDIILEFYKNDKGEVQNPYEANNEADAQAWSFPVGYREIRQRSNTWTEAEDEQFEWDMALFRSDNKLYPKDERGEALREYDKQLIAKGNPYLNKAKAGEDLPIQQVLKPIYSGYKAGDVMELDIRKMSIANLNWRLVKGTAMEPMYKAHVLANTTFINMESANKIGLVRDIQPMYVEGKANTTVEHEHLTFKYFGIQVETKTQKDEATLGTQLTKLAILNLMMGGVPLDFIKAHNRLSKQHVKARWEAMNETQKLATSRHYSLVRRNSKLLSAMKLVAKNELFNEFGLSETIHDNGKRTIDFTNLERFESLIQRELKNRQAPQNIRDAAVLIVDNQGNKKFRVPIDLQIGSDKLEAIITSMIDRRILRPKMFGGQMPQIASTLLEEKAKSRELVYKDKKGNYQPVEDLDALTKEEKKTIRITSNDLHFYTPEEPWIEVKLPFYMQEFIDQGRELKIEDLPDDLRWAIGFRIPTQELNSVEHIRIKGFLPAEYGDSIVVPTEITTKAGSDFDIDKLNLYLYNYFIDDKGKPKKIEYKDNSNSTTEDRYDIVRKQALRPYFRAIDKYLRKIKKKERKIKTLQQDLEIFENFVDTPHMEHYNKLVSDIFKFGLKTMQDALAADQELESHVFEVEGMMYNLYELEDKLRDAIDSYDVEHPIEQFRALPIELQNTKEAIDNAYIDNIRDLVTLEDNFAQLVQPNSVTILRREAYAMNFLWRRTKSTKKTKASYLDSMQNAFTRLAFLVGKAGVGIGAASQTLHAVSQMLGAGFSETTQKLQFNFPTNSYVEESTGLRHYDISAKLTTDNVSISSIISAFINAFVDVAKDPWVLDINGNASTAGIYITAFKLGMPVKEVVRWFNQPVIKDYIKMVQKSRSVSAALSGTEKKKKDIIDDLGAKYGFPTEGWNITTTPRTGNYTTEELEGYIKEWQDKEETPVSLAFRENQANLLAEFLKLEGISWDLFRLGQALNQDTSRTVSFDSIRNKWADVVRGLRGPFRESIIKAMNDTFIGTILLGKIELLEGMRSQYLTESPAARSILNPMLRSIFMAKGSKDVKEKIVKEMRKEFLTYLLQTIPISIGGKEAVTMNSAIGVLFKRDGSLAERLRSLQIEMQKPDGKVPKNFLIQNMLGILPVLVDKASVLKNIALLRRMSDKVDSDHATADWYNLGNHPLTRDFMYDLIKFSLLQNGLKGGPNSFTHLIPNEVFADIARQVDEFFQSKDIIELLSGFEASYYQNNWWNRDLIPKDTPIKKKFDKEGRPVTKSEYRQPIEGFPKMIFKWAEPENGVSDFPPSRITRSAKYIFVTGLKMVGDPNDPESQEPAFDKATREKMRKKGDFSYLDQVLYKRVEIENKETGLMDVPLYKDKNEWGYVSHYVVFYPVARYGKRGELVEHFSKPSLSYVNPVPRGFVPATGKGIDKALESIGRKSGRFLSNVIGINAEDEDILLSLRPDLYQSSESALEKALTTNVTLFESAKTAKEIAEGELTKEIPGEETNTSQNPLDCD